LLDAPLLPLLLACMMMQLSAGLQFARSCRNALLWICYGLLDALPGCLLPCAMLIAQTDLMPISMRMHEGLILSMTLLDAATDNCSTLADDNFALILGSLP